LSLNHTKQKSWPQRLLALLAAVVLCAALPAAALAEENTASIQTQVSETDEDIPWADPPQSTPETGRPDPAVPTPPPQDPATPETAQTGEHLEGYSLSLGETITIYFYVTLPEDTPQDAAMQFTLPDSTVTQVAVADAKQVEVNGKSCTAFPCQVAAKQLTDDIEARMVVNGKYGPVYTYTVKDYLNYLLEHDYPQQAKELAGTLLVYGGKAQLYFGYRTDALAGTAEPNSTANWGSYQFESSGTQTDDYYGSSLLLEPATILWCRTARNALLLLPGMQVSPKPNCSPWIPTPALTAKRYIMSLHRPLHSAARMPCRWLPCGKTGRTCASCAMGCSAMAIWSARWQRWMKASCRC